MVCFETWTSLDLQDPKNQGNIETDSLMTIIQDLRLYNFK